MKPRSSTYLVVMTVLMTLSTVFGASPVFRDKSGTTADTNVSAVSNPLFSKAVAPAVKNMTGNAGFFCAGILHHL